MRGSNDHGREAMMPSGRVPPVPTKPHLMREHGKWFAWHTTWASYPDVRNAGRWAREQNQGRDIPGHERAA